MKYKFLTIVFCLIAAITTASAQSQPDNEIWYTTTDGRPMYLNSGYYKAVGLYLESDTYRNGRGVLKFKENDYIKYIYSGLLSNQDRLKSVRIPKVVTVIGDEAFKNCSSLSSVTIPDGVSWIGDNAFNGCSSLASVTIPKSVTKIGSSAFSDCSSLESFVIPEGVTKIGDSAFFGCSSLASVIIPNSLTNIGDKAFWRCNTLERITIPNSVIEIGDSAFYGCSNLPVINNIRYADTCLVEVVDKSMDTYQIKTGTRFVSYGAFDGCISLKSITIPDSVIYIGSCAFEGCI